jgi:8-oxo-dGTP diphosphatase
VTHGEFQAVPEIRTKMLLQGALREAVEETGLDPALVTPVVVHEDNHGNWKYDTVIAAA